MDKSKKVLFFMSAVLCAFYVYGCTVRTYTVEKPRVDTEITGNQGYVSGTPKAEEPKKKLSDKRKTTVVEVELKAPKEEEAQKEPERVESAQKMPEAMEEAPAELLEEVPLEEAMEEEVPFAEPDESVYEEAFPEPEEVPAAAPVQGKPQYKIYTVQKNDTLQKISYKFYNTTKRWNEIYAANKDILKGPDKIYPGQVLKIPAE